MSRDNKYWKPFVALVQYSLSPTKLLQKEEQLNSIVTLMLMI